MVVISIVRRTQLSAEEAWVRLTDWERHGEFIPLTRVSSAEPLQDRAGSAFVARTSLGPFGFDDPMEVTFWQPPTAGNAGVCRVVKRGRIVLGWAALAVTPTRAGSTVSWQEAVSYRLVGDLFALPNRIVGRKLFGRLVDGLLADGGPSNASQL